MGERNRNTYSLKITTKMIFELGPATIPSIIALAEKFRAVLDEMGWADIRFYEEKEEG